MLSKASGIHFLSEVIHDTLRSWVHPSVTLSEETLTDLEESREQIKRDKPVQLTRCANGWDWMTDVKYSERPSIPWRDGPPGC